MSQAADEEPTMGEAVAGCGCLTLFVGGNLWLLIQSPIAIVTHWLSWLPLQLLSIFLVGCSIHLLIGSIASTLEKTPLGELIMRWAGTVLLMTATTVLLYVMWLGLGAKTQDSRRLLPEFSAMAANSSIDLPEGVYIFECPRAIFGQAHWGIWIQNRGGFELSGNRSRFMSGLDYANPYWRELEIAPQCEDLDFSEPIPVNTEELIQIFNEIRGIDQLHWDADNNCKTQTVGILSDLAGMNSSDFLAAYGRDLDTWRSESSKPVLRKDLPTITILEGRKGALFGLLVLQPLLLVFFLAVLRGLVGLWSFLSGSSDFGTRDSER